MAVGFGPEWMHLASRSRSTAVPVDKLFRFDSEEEFEEIFYRKPFPISPPLLENLAVTFRKENADGRNEQYILETAKEFIS